MVYIFLISFQEQIKETPPSPHKPNKPPKPASLMSDVRVSPTEAQPKQRPQPAAVNPSFINPQGRKMAINLVLFMRDITQL